MSVWQSKRSVGILLLAPLLISAGCATLTRRRMQPIPVTSSPAGATVIVNGERQGVTPLSIRLVRKERGQIIRIESSGYNPVEIWVKRKISRETIPGSFLLGLAPGIVPALLFLGSAHSQADPSDAPMILSVYLKSVAVFGAFFVSMDLGSGKGYTLAPENLMVTLAKAGGSPRVDTVLLDADGFRNVKWIRIYRD